MYITVCTRKTKLKQPHQQQQRKVKKERKKVTLYYITEKKSYLIFENMPCPLHGFGAR